MVLVDGEVVALQQGKEAAPWVEEESVGEAGTLVGTAGEAVAVDLVVVLVLTVEALEEPAVKIGNGSEDF